MHVWLTVWPRSKDPNRGSNVPHILTQYCLFIFAFGLIKMLDYVHASITSYKTWSVLVFLWRFTKEIFTVSDYTTSMGPIKVDLWQRSNFVLPIWKVSSVWDVNHVSCDHLSPYLFCWFVFGHFYQTSQLGLHCVRIAGHKMHKCWFPVTILDPFIRCKIA